MTDEPQLKTQDSNPLQTVLLEKLRDFSIGTPEDLDYSDMIPGKLDREGFPVPELVLLLLRNVLRWRWSGKEEKVRWSVYGAVAGEPVIFELGKFGLKLYRRHEHRLLTKRITGQLRAAIKLLERLLRPYINDRIKQGDVAFENHVSEFMGRYKYFRKNAGLAYRRAERQPKPRKVKKGEVEEFIADLSLAMNHQSRATTHGFYNSVAMVDSYFSSVEHRLILLRAFTGKAFAEGGLQTFLKMSWDEKLNEILGPRQPASTGRLIKQLRDIKERIRNPFAHGGYENDKGALHVHVPGIGFVPGNLTEFGKSPRFSWVPVEAADHAEHCRVFDDLDKLLQSNHLAAPHRLMMAGIDPSFDVESLQEYLAAVSADEETLEGFIDHWGYLWEREANMDY